MFEKLICFFKNLGKKEEKKETSDTAKERLHLVLMQDRANVSADFLELMKQEIIEVIKKYIEVDEKAIDVHLTNKSNEDGTVGAPALYANIPIMNIRKEDIIGKKAIKDDKEELKENVDNKDTEIINEENKSENEIKQLDEEKNIEENNMTDDKNTDESKEENKAQETSA